MAPLAVAVAVSAGLVWSFFLGYVTLRLRHFRNARLVARGAPAMKDCVYPLPIVWVSAVLGAASAVIAMLVGAGPELTIALALVAASPLFGLMIVRAWMDSRRGSGNPSPGP